MADDVPPATTKANSNSKVGDVCPAWLWRVLCFSGLPVMWENFTPSDWWDLPVVPPIAPIGVALPAEPPAAQLEAAAAAAAAAATVKRDAAIAKREHPLARREAFLVNLYWLVCLIWPVLMWWWPLMGWTWCVASGFHFAFAVVFAGFGKLDKFDVRLAFSLVGYFLLALAVELIPRYWILPNIGWWWTAGVGTYKRLLLFLWDSVVGSFAVSTDLAPILVSGTYRVTTRGRHVPPSCLGITFETATEREECRVYVDDHEALLGKVKLLVVHLTLVVVARLSFGRVWTPMRVLFYLLAVVFVLDWEQVVFAVSIATPILALVSSHQWVLCVAALAVVRYVLRK